MSRLRPSARIFASLLWTLPGVIAVPSAALAQNAPREALIIASRDSSNSLTLGVGSDDGAKIGQTYRVRRGNAGAKIQIMALTPTESTALLIAADAGFTIAVGDTAVYLGEEALQAPLRPSPTTSTLPALPAAPTNAATSTPNNPGQALLTSVTGSRATLGIGAVDGARVGAVYALPLGGNVKARLQVIQVRPTDSLATISIIEEGFVPTVGDVTRFLGVEALPVAPTSPVETPRTQPAKPSVQVPPTTPIETPAPVFQNPPTPAPMGGSGRSATTSIITPTATVAPVASLSGATATVTAIQNGAVTISAGSLQGARASQNVPILRGGEVIGLLRLQAVSENSSSGVILYRDETIAPIAPGDAVGLLGANPSVGAPQTGTLLAQNPANPATAVKYETGASNFAVPKANPTYELLAALASSGLIRSQPPSVFQDEGARRHRTAEDILFSRAQVATLVREAISNSSGDLSGRDRAALSLLTKEFRRDLVAQGETEATLTPFQEGRGFGISGFSRFTGTVGDVDEFTRDPFSESYGARRTRSGFDSRSNIFGQISNNLAFYGSVDYGSDIQRGTSNIFDVSAGVAANRESLNNLQVRKAYLSYDAQSLLRGLTVNVGRKEFWWGPGQFGTTILSDASGGLNSLSTVFERGSYRLEGLYSYLGRGPAGGKRSLYGQNLSVKVGPSVRVGVNTTVLSPKDTLNPTLFLGSFTPVSLYVLRRGERNSNTNALVGGFAEAAVARGARVYGEIVLDDLAVNERNGVENRNGSLVGVQVFNPSNPAKAGFTVEYARLNSISYLAFLNGLDRDPDYYYQFRNAPLGYAISPVAPTIFGGAESLRFEGHYMPLRRLRINAGLEFADVNTEDQGPAPVGGRGFSRQQIYRLAVAYDLSRTFSLTARAQRIDTNQPNFIRNEINQKDNFFSLEIGRSF